MMFLKTFPNPGNLLRHPPDEAVLLGMVYTLVAVSSFVAITVHDPDAVDATIAVAASVLGMIGGVVAAGSQLRAFWFLERGALWALWAGLLVRVALVIATEDVGPAETVARSTVLIALCVVLIPRYREIQGADQNPRVA